MRVAIVAPRPVPDVIGGAERLYDGLLTAFRDRTPHEAELIKIAAPEHSFAQLIDSYDAFSQLELSAFDLVVSTKYPSWMVRHPRHVVYMLHTLRGLYDTYHLFGLPTNVRDDEPEVRVLVEILHTTAPGTTGGARRVLDTARWVVDRLGDDHPACRFPGSLIRSVVHWLDRDALDPSRVRGHFAISRRVTERDGYFPPGVTARSLPPPTSLDGLAPGPYRSFFTASRLDGPKRIDLLIAAMGHVTSDVQLRIAGTGPEEDRLRALAAHDPRIVLLGRINEDELRREYTTALAVPFVPLDEDFGLVTVEAQLASKPVVTCVDSGGVTELVENGVSGFIVDPDPRAIARALDDFAHEPGLAERMGSVGARSVREITWHNVVSPLIDAATSGSVSTAGTRLTASASVRPDKLVVLSTYPASPARGGGQLRLNRLLRGLTERFDVDVVTLDDAGGTPGITELGAGCRQVVIARSPEHLSFEGGLGRRSPIPIGDIAATLFVDRSRAYLDAVHDAVEHACLAILEQPYLLPALWRVAPSLPFIYDSQNAEADMKRMLLAGAVHAAELVDVVRTIETHAVRSAELVATCAPEDRERLEQLGPTLASWTHVPNGGDVFDIEFVTEGARARNRDALLAAMAPTNRDALERVALFVASYHPPNLEAAETIARIAPQLPHVAFLLAGSHGNHFTSWRLPPNVFVLGMVSDHLLRRLLSSTDVALNPIVSGGGTNLKLIEYFAAGAPVVSSELGVRGIDVEDGTHVLLATDAGLVQAIAETVADPGAASQRARRARALAEADYDWSIVSGHFAAAIEGALSGSDW